MLRLLTYSSAESRCAPIVLYLNAPHDWQKGDVLLITPIIMSEAGAEAQKKGKEKKMIPASSE